MKNNYCNKGPISSPKKCVERKNKKQKAENKFKRIFGRPDAKIENDLFEKLLKLTRK